MPKNSRELNSCYSESSFLSHKSSKMRLERKGTQSGIVFQILPFFSHQIRHSDLKDTSCRICKRINILLTNVRVTMKLIKRLMVAVFQYGKGTNRRSLANNGFDSSGAEALITIQQKDEFMLRRTVTFSSVFIVNLFQVGNQRGKTIWI